MESNCYSESRKLAAYNQMGGDGEFMRYYSGDVHRLGILVSLHR